MVDLMINLGERGLSLTLMPEIEVLQVLESAVISHKITLLTDVQY